MEQQKKAMDVKDFPGVYLLGDPIDLPSGASQEQVNAKSDQVGQLSVRGGALPVSFDYSA